MKSAIFYRHTEIKDLVLMQRKTGEIQNSREQFEFPKHNKVKQKKREGRIYIKYISREK